MTSTPSDFPDDIGAAMLADGLATDLACAAHMLARRGDHATADALRAVARHNRITALKLRVGRGLPHDKPQPVAHILDAGPAQAS